jgi:hypothetical protein
VSGERIGDWECASLDIINNEGPRRSLIVLAIWSIGEIEDTYG